ncbi:MAG: cytochrome c-type biogenesis protein [Micropepsaceae bacterium]
MTRLISLALFALAFCWTAFAVEPDEILADPALEARARALTQDLRCVVCQNQSVDDSDAPLARDMRVLVRERIKAGDSDDQVRAFMIERYGKFVLLNPPVEGDTLVLWLAPFAVVGLGVLGAWAYIRSLARQPATAAPLSATEEDAVRRKLDEAP